MTDGFGRNHLPYGVFVAAAGPRIGVRLGNDVLDLTAGERGGLGALPLRRVLVERGAGARRVDDEHALRAGGLEHLVHRPGQFPDTGPRRSVPSV